ncbi:hypothetical protein [Spiroplasma endosymbiont of Labia minor]|uniref:hypothetical protein n=1 Tax=Spiroplasma endosymbiont of Labia minor TaxID=3066305 RepID=UPI0030CDB7A4
MVDKTDDIKLQVTHKNPDNYRLDELGMISDDVVTNEDNETTVYKNSANQVVDSLSEAQDSYTNKIHTKYQVDGNLFDNETAIISYYKNKYEVEKPDIKKIDNYHLGNSWYSKTGFDKTLDASILKDVYYNNQLINENNKDNYDSFELAQYDKEKVTELKNRPGMYYIQTKADAKGRLTGNLFQQTQDDLMQSVLDAKNWSLDSISSESVMDLIESSMFEVFAAIASVGPLNLLANAKTSFQQTIYDNFDESVSLYFSKLPTNKVNVSTDQFINILDKYGIKTTAQSYWKIWHHSQI